MSPKIKENRPQSVSEAGFGAVEEGIYSIVNQNAEHLPEKYVYIFDIDVLNRNNFLYDVNSMAETMEGMRNIKNRIFFDNVTEKTLETCN